MIKFQKGFTLIELLVVIAIIGILAGILFVAIDPLAQTNKAEIAKTKSELASIRVQAALIFSDDDDYDDVCTNANVLALLGASPAVCDDTPSTWVASKPLAGGTTHECADSTGITRTISAAWSSGAACPSS